MKLKDITKRLREIEDTKEDDESAHIRQDRLTEDVLRAIAHGVPNAQELAEEVIKVYSIDFSRWCA